MGSAKGPPPCVSVETDAQINPVQPWRLGSDKSIGGLNNDDAPPAFSLANGLAFDDSVHVE
jgi:hypothetical protein